MKSYNQALKILKKGKIVEKNSVENIFNNATEEYTKELISSVPSPLPV